MVVLHHTDCGIRHLAAYPELLALPAGLQVSGLVDDADTGRIEVVVPPSRPQV
jgi:carbonic anhydrase